MPQQIADVADVHRRIRTILPMVPVDSWTVEEAEIVWEALALILRQRQSGGDVVDLGAHRPLGESNGELADQLIV